MDLTPDQKLAGLLAPLFALRGRNDFGVGDVGALREFVDWSAENGFRVVQLLPVNETGNDNSPYNAISSVALEPTTIEMTPEALPDLTAAEIAEITASVNLAVLRAGPVAYSVVKALKRNLLERAFANFSAHSLRRNDRRARAFREFTKEEAPWLDGYLLFRALMEENSGSERWDLWPAEHRDPAAA